MADEFEFGDSKGAEEPITIVGEGKKREYKHCEKAGIDCDIVGHEEFEDCVVCLLSEILEELRELNSEEDDDDEGEEFELDEDAGKPEGAGGEGKKEEPTTF